MKTELGPTENQSNRTPREPIPQTFAFLFLLSIFPFALTSFIWVEVWTGIASRAIDGSGHYAIGQIYDSSIFPDTFGWTNAYFAGMSFPNFYPPLFFWSVSLIHHTHLFSYATAFKLVITLPLLLLPLAFWLFVWIHCGKDRSISLSVATVSMLLLTLGEVFQPSTGLDMSSTILDGFYTQPLGFLLLIVWLLVYLLPNQKFWQCILSAVLLALTILANFFNAVTATLFIASILLFDLMAWLRATDPSCRVAHRELLLLRLGSSFIALLLTAFWVVPMATSYQYLVTRPIVAPLTSLAKPALWVWYVLATAGLVLWIRRRRGAISSYLLTCALVLVLLMLSSSVAPPWFPLQVFRFFSTFNLLLAVPVGITVARLADWYLALRPKSVVTIASNKFGPITRSTGVFAVLIVALVGLGWVMSTKKLSRAVAFYTAENFDRIGGVLEFGKRHKEGRYLVEVLPSIDGTRLFRADSLALNAYLGAQGNEVISIVYREASPNSPFFNAELNALSSYTENFGVSSALMDDLDFLKQPLSQHLKRLNFIGVKYLVIATQEMKERLSKEPDIGEHYEVGGWTIYELRAETPASIRALKFKPALVVSSFTEKLRRQNQLDFIRLAEEQFNDAWFDVLLVHSSETKIDRLSHLDEFGALILDQYDFDDEPHAFNQIKAFSQNRPVILFQSNSDLFYRLKESIAELPNAKIFNRPNTDSDSWIDALQPQHHYNSSSVRQLWTGVRQILDQTKTEIPAPRVSGFLNGSKVQVEMKKTTTTVPVLISTTFHPKWARPDGKPLYAATPFFMMGFFDESMNLVFRRTLVDRAAVWCSGLTFVLLGLVALSLTIRRAFLQRPSRQQTVRPTSEKSPNL